jgi:hypothetical protein
MSCLKATPINQFHTFVVVAHWHAMAPHATPQRPRNPFLVNEAKRIFSVEKMSVGRYTLGLLITTGLGLAVAISFGFMTESGEKDFNAANEVFTPEETRWIVSFTSPSVSSTKQVLLHETCLTNF